MRFRKNAFILNTARDWNNFLYLLTKAAVTK